MRWAPRGHGASQDMADAEQAGASGRQHVAMGLQWRNINFSVPQADGGMKHILSNVSGLAQPGELLAIMGPSGAGKTSLLNALARQNPMATGEVLLNDKPWNASMNTLMAYMHQDEMFMPDLTVREHLQFQSQCRLPAMDAEARTQLVENAIVQMGLERQSDQPIGDAVAGGAHISKNERKRLNYATEILTQPSLLFVDEPTTGLDSFMAEIVVNDLKKLASGEVRIGDSADQKRTVIATIHQPSSDVFQLFDKLCLLVDGKVVYFGPCNEAVAYFETVGTSTASPGAWTCPNHTNPADFFMRLFVNPADNDNAAARRLHAQTVYAERTDKKDGDRTAASLVAEGQKTFDRSFMAQVRLLFLREVKLRIRSPVAFKATIGRIIMFGIILGTTFPNTEVDNMVVFSLNGVLFFSVFMQFFDIVMAQVNVIPFLMDIYVRENKSNAYKLTALYMAKNLADVIFDVVFTFLWCCALFWPIGFGWYDNGGNAWETFVGFYLGLLVTTFIATGAGYTAAFIVPDPQAGFLVALMFLFPFLIVAGMLVNLDSLPPGFNWLAEISYLRFAFATIVSNQWDNYGPIHCSQRDIDYLQCPPTFNTSILDDVLPGESEMKSSIGYPLGPFPSGNHVLIFMGIDDSGAPCAAPPCYKETERDYFRMFIALFVFRFLGLLAIFTKAKPKKGGTGAGAPDAQAEADQMAEDIKTVGSKKTPSARARKRDEVHLQWSGLGMVGDDGKPILSDMTGEALPGEVLAVIGPSGSGKSCLLNCLAGKQAHSGTRTPEHSTDLQLQTAYMYQEDLFLSDLTVREQLIFQAKLRLDRATSASERDRRVDEVLASVGLTKSANTLIGVIGAGISGGERKRLSFAEQILTDPAILFADEPTSGLDSAMAESVMGQLKSLALGEGGKKRTVVATIHQPSSEIYGLFDKLLVIVSDKSSTGRTAFFGSPEDALNHFGDLGHPCPKYLNPPDHFMRCIGTQGITDSAKKMEAFSRVDTICAEWSKRVTAPDQITGGSTTSTRSSEYDASWGDQFKTLVWRELILRSRSEQLFKAYVGRTIMMTTIFGLLYYQLENNQASVQSVMGCLTIVFMDSFFTAGIGVVQSVPFTFPTVFREHHNKQYSLTAYFTAKQVADIPFELIFTILFSSGTYLLFGFTFDPFSKFIKWNLYIILATLTANGLGYLCAGIGYDPTTSFLVWTFLIIPL